MKTLKKYLKRENVPIILVGLIVVAIIGVMIEIWIRLLSEIVLLLGFTLIILGFLMLFLFPLIKNGAVILIQSVESARYLIIGGLIILLIGVLDKIGVFS